MAVFLSADPMLRGFSTWDQREGNEMRLECQEMIHNTVSVLPIMTTSSRQDMLSQKHP